MYFTGLEAGATSLQTVSIQKSEMFNQKEWADIFVNTLIHFLSAVGMELQ